MNFNKNLTHNKFILIKFSKKNIQYRQSFLKDVEKYAQVYPRDINKATSGFINYNLQKQTYFVSPEFVFSDYKR